MFFWAWLTLILYQFHFGDPKGFTGLLSIIWLLLGVKCYIWLIGGLNVRTEHRKFQLEKQLKSCMCHLSNSPWMFFYESWLNYAWLSLLHLFSLFFFFFFPTVLLLYKEIQGKQSWVLFSYRKVQMMLRWFQLRRDLAREAHKCMSLSIRLTAPGEGWKGSSQLYLWPLRNSTS